MAKKQFFQQLLTVYGRKPVLEALQTPAVNLHRLHLAEGNRPAPVLDEIIALTQARDAELVYHSRQSLARISKNGRQDQGVAADIDWRGYQSCQRFLQRLPAAPSTPGRITSRRESGLSEIPPPRSALHCRDGSAAGHSLRVLALCDIHNPQNLGMIIRSACAGGLDGILLPRKGCAPLSLFAHKPQGPVAYILGNESEGIGADVFNLADKTLMIPMGNDVESLNVAVIAALIAFSNSP